MYEYFKNIAEKNSCNSIGACSLHPCLSNLYKILLHEARIMAFYLVKLKEFSIYFKEGQNKILETLSIFLINTNYNQQNYLNFLIDLCKLKILAKEKYTNYCKNNNFPCETINDGIELNKVPSINVLIEQWEVVYKKQYKNCDKQKQRLFDLIIMISRISSIYNLKIKRYNLDFDEFDYEIIRFFALTNSYSIRNEKIKRRILSFSDILLKIEEKLYKVYENHYGKIESSIVNRNLYEGHNILISGDNFFDLDNLLKYLEENYKDEKINVYTNGALFKAHLYPYFKNNKFLKGHFGSDNAEYDFSNFNGPIFVTKNFIQKIDNLYKGEVFSNSSISFEKIKNITNGDFSELVKSSLCSQQIEKLEKEPIEITKNLINFEELIENCNEISIVIGQKNPDKNIIKYKANKIININQVCDLDILVNLIEFLIKKNIKTVVFFAQCSMLTFGILISLLNKNIELITQNCSNIIVNPHIIECLEEDFSVKII